MTELGMALSNSLTRGCPATSASRCPASRCASSTTPATTWPTARRASCSCAARSVFREYWRRPEATAEAFVDGWFRTGDVAVHEAGRLPAARAVVGRHHQDRRREGVGAGDRGGATAPTPASPTAPSSVSTTPSGVSGCASPSCRRRARPTTPRRCGRGASNGSSPAKVPAGSRSSTHFPRNTLGKTIKPEVKKLF